MPSARPLRPQRPRLRKSLERMARELKDSDEFVDHIGAICARYRAMHAQDSKDAQAALKQSLRSFRRHAAALAQWLERAFRSKPGTIEAQALSQLERTLVGTPGFISGQSRPVGAWLSQTERAAAGFLDRSNGLRLARNAPRATAEALLATFDHHQLKVALGGKRTPGPIVQLLHEIAKVAGDELAIQEARHAIATAKSE